MPSGSSVEGRPRTPAPLVLLLRAHALCGSACPLMRAELLKTLLNGC